MSRGLHKNWSHAKKRTAYNERKKQPNYPRGGKNRVPNQPYAGGNKRNA